MLRSEDDAIRASILAGVQESVLPHLPRKRGLTIRIDPDAEKRIVVDIGAAPPAGTGAEGATA